MNIELGKRNGSIEITDLIEESTNNAVARRSENVELEESLLECSERETRSVVGSIIEPRRPKDPDIIC